LSEEFEFGIGSPTLSPNFQCSEVFLQISKLSNCQNDEVKVGKEFHPNQFTPDGDGKTVDRTLRKPDFETGIFSEKVEE
jgi:hypothetical protein